MWDIWHLSSSTVFYKKNSCDVSYYSVEYISFWYKRRESFLKSISDFGAMKSLLISRSKLIAKSYFNSIRAWVFLTINYLKYLTFVQNLWVLKIKSAQSGQEGKCLSLSTAFFIPCSSILGRNTFPLFICALWTIKTAVMEETTLYALVLLFLCWHNKIWIVWFT